MLYFTYILLLMYNILSLIIILCTIIFTRLEGEDLNFKERTKKQKEQVKDILLQQMQEKRMKHFSETKEAQDWESMLLDLDKKALQTAWSELNNNRKDAKRLSNLNKSLVIVNYLQMALYEMLLFN